MASRVSHNEPDERTEVLHHRGERSGPSRATFQGLLYDLLESLRISGNRSALFLAAAKNLEFTAVEGAGFAVCTLTCDSICSTRIANLQRQHPLNR